MSLTQEIRDKLKVAMKSGDEISKSIYRLVLGEIDTLAMSAAQGNKPPTDGQISKIISRIISSNKETLSYDLPEDRKGILLKENEILESLNSLVPKPLTQEVILEKISSILDEIKTAPNEGKAIGLAMKLLKDTNELVDGNDVKAVVLAQRN